MNDGQQIVDILIANGWTNAGTKPGYVRLTHRHDLAPILVPVNPESPEYADMLEEVALRLTHLASCVGSGRC